MEGGPSPNVYRIPTAIGFTGHTSIKRRLPSMTIGPKRDPDLKHGHGILYDLRNQSRYGKLHQPNYDFGHRRPIAQEGLPAPNTYNPKIESVRPKAPQISFKDRTPIVKDSNPAPNAYKLSPVAIQLQSNLKSHVGRPTKPRFQSKSEGVPAPNTYNLSPVDTYKYRQAVNTSLPQSKRMTTTSEHTPSPNSYYPNKAIMKPKTFGQKHSYKQIVYLTKEDLTY